MLCVGVPCAWYRERPCHPRLHLLISLGSKATLGIFLTEVCKGELLFLTAGLESKEDIGWVMFEKHSVSPMLIPGDVADIEDTVLTLSVQLTV